MLRAGTPQVLINQLVGALVAYGLAGLRNEPKAIFAWIGIVGLQCLVSNQFLITCIWLTATAVRSVNLIPDVVSDDSSKLQHSQLVSEQAACRMLPAATHFPGSPGSHPCSAYQQCLTASCCVQTLFWLSRISSCCLRPHMLRPVSETSPALLQDTGYTIASFYLTFSLLLAGYYIRIPSMILSVARGLSWASFSHYTFEAMAVNELGGRNWTQPCPTTGIFAPSAPCLLQIARVAAWLCVVRERKTEQE